MRASFKIVLTILFCIFTTLSFASTAQNPWFSKGEKNQLKLHANVYLSSTCPHCLNEDAFLRQLQLQKPWLEIHRYVINVDKAALQQFQQELKQHHLDDYSVPALFFCDSRWVGFDKAETTGQAISQGLEYCYKQIAKTGHLNQQTKTVLGQWAAAGTLAPRFMSLTTNPAVFIPLVALTDALSSCSLFCALALFAFLWLYKEKSVMFGLGMLYIVIVAITHHYQQEYTIFFYQALSWLRIPAVLIGLGLIAYIFIIYSKGTNIRPGFSIPILVGLTALALEAYQQTCLPNFALVFTHWLDLQSISVLQRKFYMILYHTIYIIPLAILMIFIIYSRSYKKVEKSKPLLVCLAWCLLLIIGILLIVNPYVLANLYFSVASLFVALIAAWETVKKIKPI